MLNRFLTVGATFAALAMLDAGPAEAQRVSADIHIGGWPVAGTIHVGDRYGRRRPGRDVVLVRRDFPRRIVVERFPGKSYRRHLRGARLVIAYYDADRGFFFERPSRGLREVRLRYVDGRYFPMDDRFDRDRDRYDRDRGFRNGRGRFGDDHRRRERDR